MEQKLIKQFLAKSVEAFLMAIEIYNKPTIKYRVEGFSMFICNAWELMLKAKLLIGNKSIYYKNDENRSLSLGDCLKEIYTDKHTHKRKNLELIINLRNTSTHFINEDYEAKYVPLFQACVLNFEKEIKRFHDIKITDFISDNFLVLSFNYNPLTNEEIKLKYPSKIAQRLITQSNEIEILSKEIKSDSFSIDMKQKLYFTKHEKDADFKVSLDKNSDIKLEPITKLKDPSNTHKYSFNVVIEVVTSKMLKENIKIDYKKGFNKFVLSKIIDFYGIKENAKYAYKHIIGKQETFTYSDNFIEFILDIMRKSKDNFMESLQK
nr:MAG TPA: Protein of unknown function (DUF3644) [Caudoviricetes sp.]